MFDKSTYNPELINTKKQWDTLQDKFLRLGAEGKQKEQQALIPKLNKAYEDFAKEHDKWCEKYGYNRLKLRNKKTDDEENYEVIGNIHENPELIGKEQ